MNTVSNKGLGYRAVPSFGAWSRVWNVWNGVWSGIWTPWHFEQSKEVA